MLAIPLWSGGVLTRRVDILPFPRARFACRRPGTAARWG